MNDSSNPQPAPIELMTAVSDVFGSLGRALVCLNHDFDIVHASDGLDRLLGEGSREQIVGRGAEEVFGRELFGENAGMRQALEAGQRREGWGATVRLGAGKPRLLSISGAPLVPSPGSPCDPRVAYVIVARPPGDTVSTGSAAPTIFSGMVARSARMLEIFRLTETLEESEATVLLTGESGTGKEMVARAVHVHSQKRDGPFVAVNCGALPGDLLESELFGHVRGAFTGAVRDRVGRFDLASSGTIFLDEVADLSLPLQVKLLRVLQERTFERVGESTSRETDARVIAATNRHLAKAMSEDEFRTDLYYRLRVVPIEIPPLRRRREDIEPLAHHLLTRVNRRYNRNLRLSPNALRALLGYTWPGNVRELENTLEYAVAVTPGQTIHPENLPDEIVRFRPAEETLAAEPEVAPSVESDPERDRILAALEANRWRRAATADSLSISRATLWRKMRELGLGS
ncbi:MAG: sigma 54-interacting transcriptional regulator [Acidobacteriota bacterium]|nr:sigma 54-interacting transcriptional regulator [Acidobacteriota bacterium]